MLVIGEREKVGTKNKCWRLAHPEQLEKLTSDLNFIAAVDQKK
jgi:hypothetical protein